MSTAAGLILAAGAVTIANEVVFAPIAEGKHITASFNWRLVPATFLLALALNGLSEVTPGFATGLAGLTLLGAFVFQTGNAGPPISNINKSLGLVK